MYTNRTVFSLFCTSVFLFNIYHRPLFFSVDVHLIFKVVALLLLRHSIMSDSLQPHEQQQHTRLPCPSLSPGVCSNSCPSSQWYHPTISSSVVPFSSCPQSFPASVFSNELALCIRCPNIPLSKCTMSSFTSSLLTDIKLFRFAIANYSAMKILSHVSWHSV